MTNPFYNRWILEITVFVCGAVVMVFEIIGSRILSPFLGASTYIWTSLIGVILGSLSLGYWLGGRAADRRPDAKILASMIFAAASMISITVLLKEIVLSGISTMRAPLEAKSVIAALLLFAPASICLGFVTPFAVRLKMTAVESTGQTVGRLYALSTIGSIVGTFAAGFYLIPFVGSVRTLYLVAGVLVVLAILLAPSGLSRANIASVVLLVLGIAATEGNIYLLREKGGVYDRDTEYSRVQGFTTTDPDTGRSIRAIATDPYFIQSAMFEDSEDLVFPYSRYYHLIRHFKPDFERTLMIGGAGYSFPKQYLRNYPEARIDVVEIDPQMTQIARDQFRLRDDPRLNIVHDDGRIFLANSPPGQYDALLMDAFGSLFSVPYHLTTVEAVRSMERVLKPDGLVIFNLGSAISGPGSRFLQAELKTYQAVFPHVWLFKVRDQYTDDRLQNLVIVAIKSPEPPSTISEDPELAPLLAHRYQGDLIINEPVITDDLAPVEYYSSIAQNIYFANRNP